MTRPPVLKANSEGAVEARIANKNNFLEKYFISSTIPHHFLFPKKFKLF
jgi:hypothetical protein